MTDWIILIDNAADLAQRDTPHKVMLTSEYLTSPELFSARRPYVVNLSRSYNYQSEGYYASLLAEARGHRVTPNVQTMVELSRKSLYGPLLSELTAHYRAALEKGAVKTNQLFIAFSRVSDPAYARFARQVTDLLRAPLLLVDFDNEGRGEVVRIKSIALNRLTPEQKAFVKTALAGFTSSPIRAEKQRKAAKWSLGILIDPNEAHAPSSADSLKRLIRVAGKMGVEAELLDPHDLPSVAEFDALFIRATTSIDNFTYSFARRAEQDGMPVIDNTLSMIRCTNKVYLKEIMEKAGLPVPPTEVVDEDTDLKALWERLGSPVILKIPDGSFGVNMVKAGSLAELQAGAEKLLSDSALIIAQSFVQTKFDWRIGVLDGQPLFASQYNMARGHWQIIQHKSDGTSREGGFKTFAIKDVPPAVIELAVKAAGLVGDGLYGVDIKQAEDKLYVIEVNDNPNLDTDVEGAVIKDELWAAIIRWFATRLEARMR